MCKLNKELADTLCTVIALGFIKGMQSKSKIIYEEKDTAAHDKLQKILQKKLDFDLKIECMKTEVSGKTDKIAQPFIVAQSGKAEAEVAKNVNDDLCFLTSYIEMWVNKRKNLPLYGAYIGGLYDTGKLELLGPSDLWRYIPRYRDNEDNNAVANSYQAAKEVSVALETMLNAIPTDKGENIKIIYAHKGISQEILKEGQIFASVHGMTRSIFHYYAASNSKNVLLELALGEDTCKVASCIPCALFMEAVKTPASAIHLGRGDNWNFPNIPNREMNGMYKEWRTKIFGCFHTGIGCLEKSKEILKNMANLNTYLRQVNQEDIPEIFLEALSFEGSFLNKIEKTLT